ncbi:LOW QUALITY PROTEIN: Cd109 antigen-like, partial [Plakobranchus ocellatus]
MISLPLLTFLGAFALAQTQLWRPIKMSPTADVGTTTVPSSNASYWLAMSDKVRPGSPFQVSVQLLAGQSQTNVSVTFYDHSGKTVILKHPEVTVTPGGVQTFSIDIPFDIRKPREDESYYWYRAWYFVRVEGTGQDISFKHDTKVEYEEKAFSTFIQTDKGMYKPGQKVMFRVLTVLPDMTAIRDAAYDIFIKDSSDNRIRQWLAVKDPNGRGVIELWMKLADEIPTGDWTIVANIMGREETKTFTVDDYVLPRFEVEVHHPPFALAYDPLLEITVKATYTFSQPVTDAHAVVGIKMRNIWISDVTIYKKGRLSKDGTLTLQIANKELLAKFSKGQSRITSLSGWVINVEANVTETQTRRTESAVSSLTYYETPMKLRFVEEIAAPAFKPGLQYTIYAEVRRKDDTLFSEERRKAITVYFNVTYEVPLTEEELKEREGQKNETSSSSGGNDGMEAEIEPIMNDRFFPYFPTTKTLMVQLNDSQRVQDLPANGWIPLTFDIPKEATSLSISAWCNKPYKPIKIIKNVPRAYSPSTNFLQIHVGTEKPTAGEPFAVTVVATEIINSLTYQIYAKGLLLETKTTQALPDGSTSMDFSLMVTRDMVPSFSIVAFYVREENSEVVVDGLSLSSNGLFQNSMTIEFSQETAMPRDKLDLIVKAQADSLVYLLAADKSTILLKGGNDLTQEYVANDIAEYTVGSGFSPWEFMVFCGWPAPSRGIDAASVLQNSGVIFLSDAFVYSRESGGGMYGRPVDGVLQPGFEGDLNENVAVDMGNKEEVSAVEVVRKYFPEVWLWEISYITEDSGGQVSIPVTVPDTLTTWITTGFSLHPDLGLSIVDKPTELVVSKPMFVSLDLPLVIVRGEEYCFTASVFSYYNSLLRIVLTLENSDSFRNINPKLSDGEVELFDENAVYSHVLDEVETNEMRSVRFCILPTVVGDVTVKVSATTNITGLNDAVERVIVSKPEGVRRATSTALIADLSNNGMWSSSTNITFPSVTVPDSQSLEVIVSGNILASVFDNLEQLLRRPYGCGEQNMLNFAPNIFLLEFYLSTDTLTSAIKRKAVTFMLEASSATGYQKENTYQYPNGGYSTFGPRDETASTWLTAFVVKCYALAQQLYLQDGDLLAIDPVVIGKAVRFLAKTQNRDGSFTERGKVFHKEMQGASAEPGVSLTAYTLIAMYEARQVYLEGNDTFSQDLLDLIEMRIERGIQYLQGKLDGLTDSYDICLTAYALNLVDSPMKENAFMRMENAAVVMGTVKYWERPRPVVDNRHYWTTSTDSINIEMTAYALLVYSLRPDASSAGLPVLRWLTKHKGPNAGFYSTQDTIIGLQALSRVGSQLYSGEDIPISVNVTYDDIDGQEQIKTLTLDKSNELLLQRLPIPYMQNTPKSLHITAETLDGQKGPATAVVEIIQRYNVIQKVQSSKYLMTYSLSEDKEDYNLDISIKAPPKEVRSMSLLEVESPPGASPYVEPTKKISRVEMKDDVLVLYINTDVIDSEGVKIKISFQPSKNEVLVKSLPRFIRVFDYYEPQFEVTQMYTLTPVMPSELCNKLPDLGVCTIVLK